MRIAFRVDASATIGGGHVMRCLTLADEMAKRDVSADFVTARITDALGRRVEEHGHRLVRIEPPSEEARGPGWEREPWPDSDQERDAAQTGAAAGQADWLIVDHYGLSAPWEAAMRSDAARIMAIDDLANRRHDCDLLLDQNFGRAAADYRALVPEQCRILAGSAFALLRDEFRAAREEALPRLRAGGPVRRISVALGSTDIGGLTYPVVQSLLAAAPGCAVDVVFGDEASPSLEQVRGLAGAHPHVEVHLDPPGVASLFARADLAVGAAGASSWERCCLGLPSVTLVIADNQRLIASSLEALGAVATAEDPAAVGAAVATLIDDERRRERMSAAAAAVVDGRGAERVAAILAGEGLVEPAPPTLRPGEPRDSEPLWLWRNDPLMRAMAKSQVAVGWRDHDSWFGRCLADPKCLLLVADLGGTPAGMVRFDGGADEQPATVSINLAPEQRGRGLGAPMLLEARRLYYERHGPRPLQADILRGNRPSERIFTANGFAPASGPDDASPYARYYCPPPEQAG